MPIPQNITREHVFRAMIRLHQEGMPPRRGARQWAVEYGNTTYPCKLLISWANVYPNGEELDSNPNVFTTYMAQEYLAALGFTTIEI